MTSFCDIEMESDHSLGEVEPMAEWKSEGYFTLPGSGRPDYATYVIKTTNGISLYNLAAFLNEVSPGSIRIKGLVKLDNNQMVAV